MIHPTFSECFCAKHNIPPEKFARAVFRLSLYRRTYFFRWLLPLISQNYFAADFDLVYGVERLRRMRDFVSEAEHYNEHPGNRGFLRRTLRLRVSTTRLKAIIRETLPRKAGDTTPALPEDQPTAGVPLERAETTGGIGHQANTQYSS
jgi:hypothetical protein